MAVSDLQKKELRNEGQGLSHAGQGKARAVPMCRARAVLPYGKLIEAYPYGQGLCRLRSGMYGRAGNGRQGKYGK